jgi:hypothetical protein
MTDPGVTPPDEDPQRPPPEPPPIPIPVIGYAMPRAYDAAVIYRRGRMLVIPLDGMLPPACVKCGGVATQVYRRKYSWHSPFAYLGLLGCVFWGVGIVLYVIFALVLRRTMKVEVPLCDAHARSRRRRAVTAATGIIVSTAVIFFGWGAASTVRPNQSEPYAWTAAGGLVSLTVFGVMGVMAVPLRLQRMSKTHGYFTGAGPAYLAGLQAGR